MILFSMTVRVNALRSDFYLDRYFPELSSQVYVIVFWGVIHVEAGTRLYFNVQGESDKYMVTDLDLFFFEK